MKQLKPTKLKFSFIKIINSLSLVEKIATIMVIISVSVVVIYNIYNKDALETSDIINGLLLAIIPSFPVIFLWYDAQKKQWLANLDTYLDIKLMYEKGSQKTIIAFFELIPIQDGMDIRQQSQTLFRLINDAQNVAGLYPLLAHNCLVTSNEPVIFEDIDKKIPIKLYEVTFKVDGYILNTMAIGYDIDKEIKDKYIEVKKENHYWYWCPNHPEERYHQPDIYEK